MSYDPLAHMAAGHCFEEQHRPSHLTPYEDFDDDRPDPSEYMDLDGPREPRPDDEDDR